MRLARPVLLLALGLAATACSDDDSPAGPDGGAGDADAALPRPDAAIPDANPLCNPVVGIPTLALEDLAGGFFAPVAAVAPPIPGDTRLFVVEKSARVVTILNP